MWQTVLCRPVSLRMRKKAKTEGKRRTSSEVSYMSATARFAYMHVRSMCMIYVRVVLCRTVRDSTWRATKTERETWHKEVSLGMDVCPSSMLEDTVCVCVRVHIWCRFDTVLRAHADGKTTKQRKFKRENKNR